MGSNGPLYCDEGTRQALTISLHHGDCLEVMPTLADNSVDMVLVDLPYGTTQARWDSIIPLGDMWDEVKRVVKPKSAIVMTSAQPFTTKLISSNMPMFKYCWVWDKKSTTGFLNAKKRPLKRVEDVCVFSDGLPPYHPIKEIRGKPRNKGSYNKKKGDGDMVYGGFESTISRNNEYYPTQIIEISNAAQKGKVHPTQKPVVLMEYLIKTYTLEGETVLDFTMGSGTTGVACQSLGRNFIGIEMDQGYFDIASERINKAKLPVAV